MEYQLKLLTLIDGRCPFEKWYRGIRDTETLSSIRSRLRRARDGNIGDSKSIGDGVNELRLDFGPGYRVYYALSGGSIIVLIAGGDKSSQDRDIDFARRLWREHKDATERFQRDF